MLQNYLRITLRKLVQRRAYALLNVLGLGLSIGCSLLMISPPLVVVQMRFAQEVWWGDSTHKNLGNETLVSKLKLASPNETVNKHNGLEEKEAPVAGVIQDYHNWSLSEPISPIVFSSRADSYSSSVIQLVPGNHAP